MFGISYVTFVFCIMYYAPNRLLPGCTCYWFTPIRYYQLISCINWPLVPAPNRGSQYLWQVPKPPKKPQPATAKKLPAQWVWKTAQLGGKTAELATLPVTHRIQYKLALMMFLVHSHQCPDYMSNTVSLVSDDPGRFSTDYHVPHTRTKFGDRAFSIAGPKVWNNLPQSVRSADSLDSFKRKLKFYLFNSCFNIWTVYVCVLL